MWRFAIAVSFAAACIGCGGSANQQEYLRTFSGHSDRVCAVAFTPNGKQIVSGSADGNIKIWDVESGQCQRTLDAHTEWVDSVALSPDGRFVASAGKDLVKLWDVESGEELKTFVGHSDVVLSVAYSPDGRLLASCGRDRVIRLWDVASGKSFKNLATGDFLTSSMVLFSIDGKQVLFAGDTLQLWDIDTGERRRTFQGHSDSVGAIAMSRNSKWIASVGSFNDRTARLWDANSGKCVWKQDFAENQGARSVVFVSEDSVLVSGHHNGTIRYWSVESGECLRTVKAPSDVYALAADLNGQYCASGSWDKCIRLWKVPPTEPNGR